jgi:hypothetical protein
MVVARSAGGEVSEGPTRRGWSTIDSRILAVCVGIAVLGLIIGLSVGLTRNIATPAAARERAPQQRGFPHEREWRDAPDHRKVFRVDAADSTTQHEVGGFYSYMGPGTWVKSAEEGNGRWCKLVKPLAGGTRWTLYRESAHLASLTMSEVGEGDVINDNGARISARGILRPVDGVWAEAKKLAMMQAYGGKYHYYTFERLGLFRDVWQMNMRGLSGLPWFLTTSGCPHVGGRVLGLGFGAPSAAGAAGPFCVLYTYDTATNMVACMSKSETGSSDWKRIADDSAQDIRVYQES